MLHDHEMEKQERCDPVRGAQIDRGALLQILPLHKVKKLIKSENSVKAVSGEASFAIARATVNQLLHSSLQCQQDSVSPHKHTN